MQVGVWNEQDPKVATANYAKLLRKTVQVLSTRCGDGVSADGALAEIEAEIAAAADALLTVRAAVDASSRE